MKRTTVADTARNAGLINAHVRRSTGRVVGVYDGTKAALDTDGGRWSTICEDHGFIVSHSTLKLANEHARSPEQWCEPCADELEASELHRKRAAAVKQHAPRDVTEHRDGTYTCGVCGAEVHRGTDTRGRWQHSPKPVDRNA